MLACTSIEKQTFSATEVNISTRNVRNAFGSVVGFYARKSTV